MRIYTKYMVAMFLAATLITFVGSTFQAKAWEIGLTIYFGKGSSCSGRGFCRIDINVDLRTASAPSNGQFVKGDATLQGDYLVIKLKEPLKETGKSENGKFVVSAGRSFTYSDAFVKQLGLKSLKLADGNYELSGQTLKIKVAKAVKLDTKNTQKSN